MDRPLSQEEKRLLKLVEALISLGDATSSDTETTTTGGGSDSEAPQM
jgi:hypothetical protein